jgi:hypothetical protein
LDFLKISWVLFLAAGAVLVAAALVGPLIQANGFVSTSGPPAGVQFNTTIPYWTDTFGIPPMQPGEVMHVVAGKTGPGNITIQIIGYGEGNPMPEVFTINLDNQVPAVNAEFTVHRSAAYIFLVTSYYSRYSLVVSGVWGAYSSLRVGLYWGVVLLIAGAAAYYYYTLKKRKEAMFRKALQGSVPSQVDVSPAGQVLALSVHEHRERG